MKFLCLGYFDRSKMDAAPAAEISALMQECGAQMEPFYAGGKVEMDSGLATEGKYLRREAGKLKVADAPFEATKLMVGSAFLIEAADVDEALKVAALHPTIHVAKGEQYGWCLEVRPVHYFKAPLSPSLGNNPQIPA